MTDNSNPWTEIGLRDYELHMGHPQVRQLQTLSAITKEQLCLVPAENRPSARAAILGIAGGNGLEHAQAAAFRQILGLDINPSFLRSCRESLPHLRHNLTLEAIDLIHETPRAAALLEGMDLLTANLLIEHIRLSCFLEILGAIKGKPNLVSCVIQLCETAGAVSASGYEAAFASLGPMMEEPAAEAFRGGLLQIGYRNTLDRLYPLPDGKQLNRLDFVLQT